MGLGRLGCKLWGSGFQILMLMPMHLRDNWFKGFGFRPS